MVLKLAGGNKGFIAIHLLTIMLVIVLSVACILIGTAFGAKKNAVVVYGWLGEAANFAAQAANPSGDPVLVETNIDTAYRYFCIAFSEMTDTSYTGGKFMPQGGSIIKGPVEIKGFDAVNQGEWTGTGTAECAGYMVRIEVPVFSGRLPFVSAGEEITVPMKCFGVVKTITANK